MWVNYKRPRWYLIFRKFRPLKNRINWVPMGGRRGPWVLDQLNLDRLNAWTIDQQWAAKDLLVDSADVFSKNDLDVGKCNILKHNIKITDSQPFKERYGRIPPHLYKEMKAHLQEMEEVGAIRRSFSPWASVVVLVRKKDGGLRFELTSPDLTIEL